MRLVLSLVILAFSLASTYAQQQQETAALSAAPIKAAEGTYQVFVRNSPNQMIVPIPEEILILAAEQRDMDEDFEITLSEEVKIVVFPYRRILDPDFAAPAIYVFID